MKKRSNEELGIKPDWYGKQIESEKKAKEQAIKIEHERIGKLKCPSCDSTMKEHIVKSDNNGVFGPGYRSWVRDEYFVCLECGTMYKDLNKNDNTN
jgi:transposase-like protein